MLSFAQRDLSQTNIGPRKRGRRRQRLGKRSVEKFFSLIEPALAQQSTRQNQVRFLKMWGHRQNVARNLLRLYKILGAEGSIGFYQCFLQVARSRRGIVAIV